MTFSADGHWLVTIDSDGVVQIFRIEPSHVTLAQTLSATPGTHSLAFRQDSQLFGAIQADGSGIVWRIGEAAPTLLYGQAANATTYNLVAFAFVGDQLLLTIRQDDLAFYRLSDAQVTATLPIQGAELAISPVSNHIR
jgi:hypothetical protein